MANADLDLQTELFERITAAFTADGVSVPVVAHALPEQAVPYCIIGEVANVGDHVLGQEFETTIKIFSRADGPHEVKEALNSIRSAVHGLSFDGDNFRFTCIRVEFMSAFLDPTEDVWQGVQRIRALASAL